MMAKGYTDVKVTRNYVYFDQESNEYREIDVISFSPLYILECTGFLKANEIRKLKRLLLKNILELNVKASSLWPRFHQRRSQKNNGWQWDNLHL